jgi:predicted Fe-Mo cluster-binding NifX family protein
MRIAVASQNRKTVTGHAGKCRKFWIYDTDGAEVLGKILLELPMEQSFHESHDHHHGHHHHAEPMFVAGTTIPTLSRKEQP